jgi:hypothetical protein
LARDLRISTNAVKRWFGRRPSVPDGSTLIQIAKVTETSLNWLLLGMGPPALSAAAAPGLLEADLRSEIIRQVSNKIRWSAEEMEVVFPSGDNILESTATRYAEFAEKLRSHLGQRFVQLQAEGLSHMRPGFREELMQMYAKEDPTHYAALKQQLELLHKQRVASHRFLSDTAPLAADSAEEAE